MKLELTCFCNANNNQSPTPGQSQRVLSLVAIRNADPKLDPNSQTFTGTMGSGAVSLHSVTAEVAAGFKSGAKYRVTIEEMTDVVTA